ncbi:MAG: serine/threonine-protein kinase [Myxococcota bacterium]
MESPKEDRQLIGRVIGGKLRITEHLGSGSMGRVYRAHHLSLDKDVAIKVLRESAMLDPNRSRRFAHEARAASRLNHPNSVSILDFGEDGDDKLLYIAMELLRGEDLQAVIDRGTILGVDRICHIMVQALAALAAAHDEGIIHRDVKPSNIVLVTQRNDEGVLTEVVKVCDFGVAKFAKNPRDTLEGSRAGQRVVGTPLYMSPEQAVGDPIDIRTDVYSCGIIMYEMLTGQPPFNAETPMGVLMQHVSGKLRPPSELVPGVPRELEALILWALEKNRERRPSTARELRNGLRAFLAGQAKTIPELARYGIQTVAAPMWTGPTPLSHLEISKRPHPTHSALLAAPKLPELVPPYPPSRSASGELVIEPVVAEADPPSSGGLGADLGSPAGLPEAPTDPSGEIPRRSSSETREAGLPPPISPAPFADAPAPRTEPDAQSSSRSVGLRVPEALRASAADLDPELSEDGAIFREHSFFHFRHGGDSTETVETSLEAPPPRALSRVHDTDADPPRAPRDEMARYLWSRFGMSPERSSPPDGFWLRDAEERELGPLTWSETTHALRMEAHAGEVENVALSTDQATWMSAERFVRLTGVEAILAAEEPFPEEAVTRTVPRDTSVAGAFAEVSPGHSGRLMFRMKSGRSSARFDIHVNGGRPTFVFTNEPRLQLPNLLVAKGVVDEHRIPAYIREVVDKAMPLEEVVRHNVKFDVASYRSAVMKERLRHLLRWPEGELAFVIGARPVSRQAFATSLLTLLPDLVYRTLSAQRLEEELRKLGDRPVARILEGRRTLDAMDLTRSQRGVAERLLTAPSLSEVLPASGRVRKAYTTMAYVLSEIGLLGRRN